MFQQTPEEVASLQAKIAGNERELSTIKPKDVKLDIRRYQELSWVNFLQGNFGESLWYANYIYGWLENH